MALRIDNTTDEKRRTIEALHWAILLACDLYSTRAGEMGIGA